MNTREDFYRIFICKKGVQRLHYYVTLECGEEIWGGMGLYRELPWFSKILSFLCNSKQTAIK